MLLTGNNNSNIIIQASNQGIQQLSDHPHLRSISRPLLMKKAFSLALRLKSIQSLQTHIFTQPPF